jgi:hypothetical protein
MARHWPEPERSEVQPVVCRLKILLFRYEMGVHDIGCACMTTLIIGYMICGERKWLADDFKGGIHFVIPETAEMIKPEL